MTGRSNSPFLAACRREKTPFTPVWLMRQAGRYMQEYRKLRAEYGFLKLCKNPQLAAEITITPIERLKVDAAILFADILLLLEPMGVGLEYSKGDGPVIHRPVRTAADVDRLKDVEAGKSLSFVFETIRECRRALSEKVPLIGFSGALFTLASYLIEGSGSRNYVWTKSFFYKEPEAWHTLMSKLAVATAEYLNGQIAAGAQAVQIFDSWAGCLAPGDYERFVLPYTRAAIKAITPVVPVIHFSTGTAGCLNFLRAAGGDVIGVDWRMNLDDAWAAVGHEVAIQGNLDPVALFAPPEQIRNRVREILDRAAGRRGHMFNLGHGILPETPVENVIVMVEAVHELSGR